jgi:hypothetical protein
MIGQRFPKVIDPISFPSGFDVGVHHQYLRRSFAFLNQCSHFFDSIVLRGSADVSGRVPRAVSRDTLAPIAPAQDGRQNGAAFGSLIC